MKRKRPSGAADSPYDTFLSSFRRVSSRLGPCQEAIASLLEPDSAFEPPRFVPGGPEITFSRDRGLLKIRNLLPEDVALALLDILEALPEERWRPTAAPDDPSRNNVSHRFSSVKHDGTISALSPAFKVLEFLAPPDPAGDGEERMPCTLSAARYIGGDHIVPHDDRAFHDVLIDGAPVQHSRSVAMILHLTRNWDASFGGGLVDLEDPEAEGGRRYVPEFNSLVAFRVPRWHVVEELRARVGRR
ncbi:hypothetical protein DFJ74DRAFT_701192 [Hyaloraphidium curvatum]|nr:hypothetical protein DFJ74DRAFT_701192 [Hyaloraphidium curvatum]